MFTQPITLWVKVVRDDCDDDSVDSTYEPGKIIMGRWEEKQELFRNADYHEIVSKALVYLPDKLKIGDYLILGDKEDIPTPPENADEIKQIMVIPDLRGVTFEYKAML